MSKYSIIDNETGEVVSTDIFTIDKNVINIITINTGDLSADISYDRVKLLGNYLKRAGSRNHLVIGVNSSGLNKLSLIKLDADGNSPSG